MLKVIPIFFLLLISISGLSQNQLDKKVTINEKNKSLVDIVFKLSEISGVPFTLNSSLIPATEKSSLNVINRKLGDVFELLFSKYNIEFKELNGHVIIYQKKGSTSIYRDLSEKVPIPTAVKRAYLKEKDEAARLKEAEKARLNKTINDAPIIIDSAAMAEIRSMALEEIDFDTKISFTITMKVERINGDTVLSLSEVKIQKVKKIKEPKEKRNKEDKYRKSKATYFSFGINANYLGVLTKERSKSIKGVDLTQNLLVGKTFYHNLT
ncbi:MAG: hypothetical protein IH948_08925, partial [Bacteroidetes bacterium]|nr:hypothetical protein [Bacteroidota bacterium]